MHYGLKQAARLAYDALVTNLKCAGYSLDKYCPNIWIHTTRRTKFCLCVDDFGVKYFCKNDAEHLISALTNNYDITVDWTGAHFCGLNIDWHYAQGWVDIAMVDYVIMALQKLQHIFPARPQLAPHEWTEPVYGQKRQFAKLHDTSPLLNKKGIKRVQRVVGIFLYYGRAIDNTILPTLNEISASQAAPTENTNGKITMLLDYLATYPNAKIRYTASDMILHVDSDAAFLVAPKARSRVAGFYYCGDTYTKNTTPHSKLNGPVHIECKTLKHVVTSAAEAETGGLFHVCQKAVQLRHMLTALDHLQPATPAKTDNSTSASFVKGTLKQNRSKSWDMRYHWLIDQSNLDNFFIYWDKGENNLADYHTKHHSPTHHRNVRPTYILKGNHIYSPSYDDDTHLPTLPKPEQYLRARVCSLPGPGTCCNELHTSNDIRLKRPLGSDNDRTITATMTGTIANLFSLTR